VQGLGSYRLGNADFSAKAELSANVRLIPAKPTAYAFTLLHAALASFLRFPEDITFAHLNSQDHGRSLIGRRGY
jgi:hypothetical protein